MKDKKKTTYILAAIFLVLIIIAYLMADKGEKTTSYKKLDKQFFVIDSASVDKVELETAGKKTSLVKSGIEWRLYEPVDYAVTSNFVQQLISDLKNYKLESIVSTNAENKANFGFVDSSTIKISVYQNGTLAGTFLIGAAGKGASQTYIKKIDNDEIFLADGFLRNNFMKTNSDWRSKLIISIPKPMVKAVEFISDKESYKVGKDSTGKYFVGKDSVNSFTWDGILNLLNDFNTQGFKDTTLGTDIKPSNVIKVDWGKNTDFNFYSVPTDSNKYLLKVTDIKQIFEVDKGFLTVAIKSKKEILGQK